MTQLKRNARGAILVPAELTWSETQLIIHFLGEHANRIKLRMKEPVDKTDIPPGQRRMWVQMIRDDDKRDYQHIVELVARLQKGLQEADILRRARMEPKVARFNRNIGKEDVIRGEKRQQTRRI